MWKTKYEELLNKYRINPEFIEFNDLLKFFLENKSRVIHKWIHYFEVYDLYFNKFRNKQNSILEIGVNRGGSLFMWRDYFGERAKIAGIDILKGTKILNQEGFNIFIGSQADPLFLNNVGEKAGPFDIIIDDGSHVMDHQILTFEELFPFLAEGGIYLCEDCHTSYWDSYGGGYKKKSTFIEYAKNIVDDLNAYHSKDRDELKPNYYTKNIEYVHFFDSIVVFKKRKRAIPYNRKSGEIDWRKKE